MHRSFRSIGLLRSSFSSKLVYQRTNFKSQYKFSTQSSTTNFSSFNKFLGASLLIGSAAFLTQQIHAESQQEEEIFKTAGARKEGLKEYTLEEIAKHNNKDNRIWVIYKNGVYDITDFIEMHPGQDKILQAAGTSIEPFWAMYSQHLTPEILEMLEELRIGNLAPNQQMSAVLDAYASDPGNRSSVLIVRSKKPFNAETPPEVLVQSLVTPNDLFFVRNHLPVPIVNPKDYVLEITADTLSQPIKLTLDDLKKFPKAEVMATIQCAGNRRNEMTRYKEVKGGFWEIGAISNAVWTGVRLRDVLIHAGINPDDLKGMEHVQFTGLDKDFEKSYGASIPIDKAFSSVGDVILAFEMNGKELPPDHGYPVRVVVPGTVGARNVKWLHKIHASKEESSSHWQQKDYKGFSPNVDWHNVDWDSAPAIQEFPVQSAICTPANGAVLPKVPEVTVKGFAWSGGGRGIVRVDVSVDGGQTWHTANLEGSGQRYNRVWAWSLWEVKVPVPANSEKLDICCKAVDSSYNGQPEKVEPIWNLRGVLSNAWHRVNVTIEK